MSQTQEHLTPSQISRFRAKDLSTKELLAMDTHLSACPKCRDQVAGPLDLAAASALLTSAVRPPPEHLSFETLADYVDEILPLPEREQIEVHLASCAACAEEARDLLQFKQDPENTAIADVATAIAAPDIAVPRMIVAAQRHPQSESSSPQSWLQKLFGSFKRPALWIPLEAAGMAAITVLLVSGAMLTPMRHEIGEQQSRIMQLQAERDSERETAREATRALSAERARLVGRMEELRSRIGQQDQSTQAERQRLQQQLATMQEQTRALEVQQAIEPADNDEYSEAATPGGSEGAKPGADGARKHNARLAQEVRNLRARLAQVETSNASKQNQSAQIIKDGDGLLIAQGRQLTRVATAPLLPASAQRAWRTQSLSAPRLAQLQGTAPQIKGNDGTRLRVLSPVRTVVRTTRPLFRWQPAPGATAYEVTIWDETTEEKLLSKRTATTQWTPQQELTRGHRFRWQVLALDGEETIGRAPRSPDRAALFQVLSTEEEKALARAIQPYRHSPLAKGALYAEQGLLDEAQREFELLQKANPDSPQAKRLVEQIKSLRGR